MNNSNSRRDFLKNIGSLFTKVTAANVGLYVMGAAFKSLDGSFYAYGVKSFDCCFIAGTQVTTATGLVNIENIVVGQQVVIYDEIEKKYTESKVTEIFHHVNRAEDIFDISTGTSQVSCSADHLFYLPEENTYMSAIDMYLKINSGETITLLESGVPAKVLKIEKAFKSLDLYNIHVESKYDNTSHHIGTYGPAAHSYVANNFVVHNAKFGGCLSSCSKCCDAASMCDPGPPAANCSYGNTVNCTFQTHAIGDAFMTCYNAKDTSCP